VTAPQPVVLTEQELARAAADVGDPGPGSPILGPVAAEMARRAQEGYQPGAAVAPELAGALWVLLAPDRIVVVNRSGGGSVGVVSAFEREGSVAAYADLRDGRRTVQGPMTSSDLLEAVVGWATGSATDEVRLSPPAFAAVSAWLEAYRRLWAPLGVPPSKASVGWPQLGAVLSDRQWWAALGLAAARVAPSLTAMTGEGPALDQAVAELSQLGLVARTPDGSLRLGTRGAVVEPLASATWSASVASTRADGAAGRSARLGGDQTGSTLMVWDPTRLEHAEPPVVLARRPAADLGPLLARIAFTDEPVATLFPGLAAAAPAAAPTAPPAPPSAAWRATHVVSAPATAWAAPDPAQAPVAELAPGTQLRVVEVLGGWAKVDAANGWSGWVDVRLVRPMG
jgi:hypothetical protein